MRHFLKNVVSIYSLCVSIKLIESTCNSTATPESNPMLKIIPTCADADTPTKADPKKDAKAIVDSKFDPKTIENILCYRTQEECIAINGAIASLNGGKNLVDPAYVPLANNKPYDDLLFALVNDSMTVLSKYLVHYMEKKDETFIIMIFIQIDDREKFKQVYGEQNGKSFDDARKEQRRPFKNTLRVWAEANRDPEKTGNIDSCGVGEELEDERPLWNEKQKTQLEYVLMKESLRDSRSSMACYGTKYANQPKADLTNDIARSIKNHDLVDIYTSLVRYVSNGDTYLAQVLHDHCGGQDNWAMWIIILTTRRGDPMKAIDEAFQRLYKNGNLSDYIKQCNFQDPQLKNMLTVLVDPKSEYTRKPPPILPPPSPPLPENPVPPQNPGSQGPSL